MKKNDFYKKYRVSDAVPTSIEVKKISLLDFVKTLKEFLDENFSGAVVVESEINTRFNLDIAFCADYVAYFCKQLLSYFHGRDVVHINIECGQNEIRMRITSEGEWVLSRAETADLIRQARNAKFNVTLCDGGLMLTREVRMSYIYAVYAISSNIFREKLYEIFFSGYVEDDTD